MVKPSTIFRYESYSAQVLLNLKSQGIYFASPKVFNDPYDCALKAHLSEPSDYEIERARRRELRDSRMPAIAKADICGRTTDELKPMFYRAFQTALEGQIETFLNNNGVSCFAERNDDLVMWGHYGGRCKGICLEFRTQYEPFTKLKRVKYVNTMPTISFWDIGIERNFDTVIDLFCTKSSKWAYEREWRSLHAKAGTLFTYEREALKAVYFGPDIGRQEIEIVCLILQGQNPDVEFWTAERSPDKFEVRFRQMYYTPYIKAASHRQPPRIWTPTRSW